MAVDVLEAAPPRFPNKLGVVVPVAVPAGLLNSDPSAGVEVEAPVAGCEAPKLPNNDMARKGSGSGVCWAKVRCGRDVLREAIARQIWR